MTAETLFHTRSNKSQSSMRLLDGGVLRIKSGEGKTVDLATLV